MTDAKQKIMQIGLLTFAILPMTALAKQTAPANRVPIEDARKAALSTFSGKIQSEELEFEGGKWIYSFDLSNAKIRGVQEVHVDAMTGQVIKSTRESSADEAREKQNEAIEGTQK